MTIDPNTPILIGVGQCVDHWDGSAPEAAPSPSSLRLRAAELALADGGVAASAIDHVIVVRTMLDSVPDALQPFGRCANPPATLARALGIADARSIYSVVGGDQPQALVNEVAEAIFAGEAGTVLIAGAEATAAMKLALKRRIKLDWSASAPGDGEDRGLGPELLSEYERRNGLGAPTQTYPAFEHALRARWGLSHAEHLALISELWAGFSKVAAANPYAQFPQERSAEFLATPGPDNYPVADPYLKWHVAQDAVNQGAAVVLTSVGRAAELGIDPAKWVYLHGYAKVADRLVMDRADLSRSRAIEAALALALEAAGRTAGEIAHLDLYSCFPCAVLLAAEALGLDWRARAMTVTGGLPFFGGAGNNYSMHAIATIVERLRADPAAFGLVLANGGFLSKQAVGIYSATPKLDWAPVSSAAVQRDIDAAAAPLRLSAPVEARIESYTVTSKRGQPSRGYVIASAAGGRILARARTGHRATLAALQQGDPIGQSVRIVRESDVNVIEPTDRIGEPSAAPRVRRFRDVLVERRGHCLEVTLNRPDSFNALHSGVHFQLHEIWDAFERDPDLWVAIVTGAGERAFCSGNDLKVTARGGDMSLPPSGFAGLCQRFDREKPVIAAVNGLAMGGGLEIVLACDLAVAVESARVALPEVKVGLYAAAGGVQRLTRQIGRKAAMELILTGKQITVGEALALGIVNQCVADGTALQAARALADVILANSPSAIRASRAALNKLDEIDRLAEALDANRPILSKLFRTNDFREGVAAFAEKRKPTGRGPSRDYDAAAPVVAEDGRKVPRLMRSTVMLPLLILTVPAAAQQPVVAPVPDEPDIVVLGDPLPLPPGVPAYGSVTIERERLTNDASGRVEDVLGDVAGFQQFRRADSRSANPSAQGVTLRALGGNASSRALVLLDGVPLADPFFGYIPFNALAADRLARVRVTRGGGPGAFGSGAVAGTIELASATRRDLPPVSGEAFYGSDKAVEAAASVTPDVGGGFVSVSGKVERGDGFYTTPASQVTPATVRARYRDWSGSLRAVVPLDAETEIQARGLLYRDHRTLRFAGADSSSEGEDASVRLIHRGAWAIDALAYVQARNFTNRVISATSFKLTLDQRNTPATGIGGKIELRPPVGPDHVLRFGVDARIGSGTLYEDAYAASGTITTRRTAGGNTSTAGLFVEDDWTPGFVSGGRLVLTAGVRADRWTITQGFIRETSAAGAVTTDTRFADRDGYEGTGRAGALFHASDAVALRVAGYTGFRLPTLNELYRPFVVFPVTTQANATLGLERLRGIEGGVDIKLARGVQLSVTAFYNRLDGAIANVTIAPNLRQRQNVDAIVARGVEVTAHAGRGGFSLDASYAFSDSKVEASGASAQLNGFVPAQSPRHTGSATFAWTSRRGFGASLTARYVGRQYEDDLQTDVLPPATTVDGVVTVPVGHHVAIVGRAENLFDETVVTRNAAGSIDLGTPRTLWIGLRLK